MTRLLALLLASFSLAGLPAAATAQSILQEPQTKEEAKKAAEAADDAAASSDSTASSDSGILYPLIGVGFLLFAGATWWMLRDAGDAVGDSRRGAPGRPLRDDAVGRGAPKNMFTGEGEPGGKVGKRKKRDQGKRQRNARKANRPR